MKEYAIYWINIFDIVRCKHDTTQVGCRSASHALERAVSWLVTWPGHPWHRLSVHLHSSFSRAPHPPSSDQSINPDPAPQHPQSPSHTKVSQHPTTKPILILSVTTIRSKFFPKDFYEKYLAILWQMTEKDDGVVKKKEKSCYTLYVLF